MEQIKDTTSHRALVLCPQCNNIIFYYLNSLSTVCVSCSCGKQCFPLDSFLISKQTCETKKINIETQCTNHKNRQYTDYCMTCNLNLCDVCVLTHDKQHKIINFDKIRTMYLNRIPESISKANSRQAIIDEKVKVIIQELEEKIRLVKQYYESNQKISKLQLDYIQLIYNTFNSLPSINNYNIIKNLIINTTFNKSYLNINKFQRHYNDVFNEIQSEYPLVITQKYSMISDLKNQKLIKNIKPLKQEDEGTVFTYDKSNILNVEQYNVSELKQHVSPIEDFCVLDNGAIVSGCENLLCIWTKGERGFGLAKKINITKATRHNILLFPIKGNKFLFYNHKEITVYNGDSPYNAINSFQYDKSIESIIQLSDLTITAFIYGLNIECFSFNDNNLIQTYSGNYLSTKYGCKNKLSYLKAVEINDKRILCVSLQSLFIFNMNTKQVEFIQFTKTIFTGIPYFLKKNNWVLIGSHNGMEVFDVKKNNFIEKIYVPYSDGIISSFELTESIQNAYYFNEKLLSMFGSNEEFEKFIYLKYQIEMCYNRNPDRNIKLHYLNCITPFNKIYLNY